MLLMRRWRVMLGDGALRYPEAGSLHGARLYIELFFLDFDFLFSFFPITRKKMLSVSQSPSLLMTA